MTRSRPLISLRRLANALRPLVGTGWGSVSLLKKLDTENYNVVVVSPRNYFLFTPLLPSCTTGLIEHRSIMEPIRNVLRQKKATVKFYEAEATKIDYETVTDTPKRKKQISMAQYNQSKFVRPKA